MKHELEKKIANLTKIIYSLNVKNEIYEERIQELHQTTKEELELVTAKHRAETVSLKGELQAKEEVIKTLTTKHDLLQAQNIQEKAKHEQDRNKNEQEIHRVRDESRVIFNKKIKDIEDAAKSNIQSLSHHCQCLKTQIKELHQECKDKDKNYKIEIQLLKDTHTKCVAEISDEKVKELGRMRSNHEQSIDEIKYSMNEDHQRAMIDTEDRCKKKIEKIRKEMQISFDSKIKQSMESSCSKIEALRTSNSNVRSDLAVANAELKKAFESIKDKERQSIELQLSLQEATKNFEKMSNEAVLERSKRNSILEEKEVELDLNRSYISKLKEEVSIKIIRCIRPSFPVT